MNVLVVAPTLPHPEVRHAGGLYLLDHLAHLARRVDHVTLLCIDTAATVQDIERAPGDIEVLLAPTDRQPMSRCRRARHRLAARMRPVAIGPDAIEALVRAGLVERARAADVVELQWPDLEVLVPLLRARGVSTPIAVLEHDVGIEAAASRADLGAPVARTFSRIMRPLRARASRRDLDRADLVLVFKQPDIDLLRRAGVRTPIEVLAPRLDAPPASRQQAPGRVLFTGAMWRFENDRAAAWLVAEVWPAVRAAVPDATLVIAGAGPSAELRRLAATQTGVDVTGEVDDLGECYAESSVFVAPLQVAGGLKFKVAQAMLCGLPVVATTTAAAGIQEIAPPGTLWSVTDDAASFASAIAGALRDPQRAREVGAAAAAWAAAHWSIDRSMDLLVDRYRSLSSVST